MRRYVLPVLAGLMLAPAPVVGADDSVRAFTLDDGLRLRQFNGRMCGDMTPDGALIAVCMQSRQRSIALRRLYTPSGAPLDCAGSEIWLADTAARTTRRLSRDGESAWAPRWSPDAKRLAYFCDRDGKPRLWIWDRRADRHTAVEGAIARTLFAFEVPEWSPDGRFIYFKALSPDYEKHYGDSNENWPDQALPFEAYRSKDEQRGDGKSGVVLVRRAGDVAETANGAPPSAASTPQQPYGRGILDLARYDAQSGNVGRLLCGRSINAFDVSPDGEMASVSIILGDEQLGAQQPLCRLMLVPTGTSESRNVTSGEERVLIDEMRETYGISMSWSPDSQRLAVLTSGQLSDGDLLVIDVATGTVHNLTEDFDLKLTGEENEKRPLWSADGSALFHDADGELWRFTLDGRTPLKLTGDFEPEVQGLVAESENSVVFADEGSGHVLGQFVDRDKQECGFCEIDILGRGVREVHREAMQFPSLPRFHVDVAPERRAISFRASGPTTPGLIKVAYSNLDRVETMASPNDWLKERNLGRAKVLEWNLDDGSKAQGILVLPSTATTESPPPCIVKVYAGGRPSRYVRDFAFGDPATDNVWFFVARGYAAFLPDLPLEADEEPMRRIWELTQPALEALGRTGLVDMQRLGVFGHSFGGYTVNALIVQTDRFKAAVASTGACHMTSAFLQSAANDGNTGWFETGQGQMRATIWENPERYLRNSPIYRLDGVTTPLLLLHGEDDRAYQQSVEMFGGLRRLGKRVELATYPDAGHWYGNWSNDQLRDFWSRVLAWFDEHLEQTP